MFYILIYFIVNYLELFIFYILELVHSFDCLYHLTLKIIIHNDIKTDNNLLVYKYSVKD